MMKSFLSLILVFSSLSSFSKTIKNSKSQTTKIFVEQNEMDEFDPFSPNAEEQLNKWDEFLGIPSKIDSFWKPFGSNNCFQMSCQVYAQVVRSSQKLYLFVDGQLTYTWDTSTGAPGHDTPNFDQHPNGRIYDKYTSSKYPGGDYNGLGNMPYAVFIEGGFAIHGTGRGNWKRLGTPASHGCVRIHPDNAFIFNRLVREAGIDNTWITVQE